MKKSLREFLFSHQILVGREDSKNQFETLVSLGKQFGIRVRKGGEFANIDVIRDCADFKGYDVKPAFYRTFPHIIEHLSLDKLLFDQALHYTLTYGFGCFEEAGHSVFENEFIEKYNELTFKEIEEAEIIDFTILDEDSAVRKLLEYGKDICLSTRPLNNSQFDLIKDLIELYNFKPEKIASQNTIIRLIKETENPSLFKFIRLNETLKLLDEINFTEYNNTNLKKLKLKNKTRKFITAVIKDRIAAASRKEITETFERRKIWKGLIHHIHFKPVTEKEKNFISLIRDSENLSVYSEIEKNISSGNIIEAVNIGKREKGSAYILRNLAYFLSRANNEDEISFIIDTASESENPIVLFQNIFNYSNYPKNRAARTFKFVKHNLVHRHEETSEETSKRKTFLKKKVREEIIEKLDASIKKYFENKPVGKVFISPKMKNIALPIQESAGMTGLGVLPKGSRIPLEGKKLRLFTYWELVNDIDLSLFGLYEDGSQEEFSWRSGGNKFQNCIKFSGDQTSGYNGGTEYFDVDVDLIQEKHPDMKYLICCNNVFSGVNFAECFCKAGFMRREDLKKGKQFEAKTVASSFTINAGTTFAYLFAIDIEKNELIWLNLADSERTIVAGDTNMDFIYGYFNLSKIFNYESFFRMIGDVVESPEEADIIVSDDTDDIEGKTIIRSYDIEGVMKYMNGNY